MLNGYVVKMEVNPATEEIVYQKLANFGCIHTHTAKISDLEYVEKDSLNDNVFINSSKSLIDHKLIFRIKRTN